MMLKRIAAPTLNEAIEKTRSVCGEDALLVDTRKTKNGYVIVAGRPPQPDRDTPKPAPKSSGWTRGFAPLADRAAEFGLSRTILSAIEKALVGTRVELGKPGDPALEGISARVLKALIKTTQMSLPNYRVTAFVGGTGVGKTTTLAKLAAAAVHDRGESIAIVTVDTYRVAAAEQLRAFANILDVPFEIASTRDELRDALEAHADADRIFVDTSGRGPFDVEAIQRLRAVLNPSDLCAALCICAHARRIDAKATIEAFAAVKPTAAVLTKWDETEAPGEALSVLVERSIPISHITIGQEIPDDIVQASAGALAARAFSLPEATAAGVL